MKTNKKMLTAVAAIFMIIFTSSASAMGNGQGQMKQSKSKYVNTEKKSQYKNIIKSKYQSKIDGMTEDKKLELLDKVDDLEEKIENSTTYSDDKKEKYISLLEAFRETVSESLDYEEEINIDDLLQ